MEGNDHALIQALSCLDNGQYELALRVLVDAKCPRAMKHYFRAIARRALCEEKNAALEYTLAIDFAQTTSVLKFKEMMRWNQQDAVSLFNRACAFHVEHDLDHAINNYSAALKLAAEHAPSLFNRGVAFKTRDRNSPASPTYDERHGGRPDCYRAEADLAAVLKLADAQRLHAIASMELEALRDALKPRSGKG